jgi:transposase
MTEEKTQQHVFGLDIHPTCFSAAKFNADEQNVLTAQPLLLQDKLDMSSFDKWLLKNTAKGDILAMEALGISFQIAKKIERAERIPVVLESTKVGRVGKTYLKTDKVDAVKIAKIQLSGLADKVWIPDDKTIERREVLVAYKNAVNDCTRTCNRIWAFLTGHGFVVTSSMKAKYKRNPESLYTVSSWTNLQKAILEGHIGDYKQAFEKRKMFEKIIAEEVTSDPDMLKLQQFHGIRSIVAFALIAVIGDIKRFETPKKLVGYLGLQPKFFESAYKSSSGGVANQGNRYLKSLLAEAAKAFINFAPKDHSIVTWAYKLRFRKNSNVVTIAVARKLVTAIWYVLNGYGSELLEVSSMIKTKLQKQASKIGKERLRELGFINISNFIEVKSKMLLNTT